MAKVSILLDEDVDPLLAAVLRMCGVDAIAAQDAGLRSADDEALLQFAAREGRVLLTHNVSDFVKLAREWAGARRSHAGILVGRQVGFKVLLRRVSKFIGRNAAEDMRDRLDWLENYK